MPIYEYQCESCGKISEEWQKITDDPVTDCSACGAKGSMQRLISNTSFVLKGNGWYVTDFRDKKGNSATGSALADTASHNGHHDGEAGGGSESTGASESTGSTTDSASSDSTAAKTERASTTSEKPASSTDAPSPRAAASKSA